jgi:hypothetical protein
LNQFNIQVGGKTNTSTENPMPHLINKIAKPPKQEAEVLQSLLFLFPAKILKLSASFFVE